MYIGFWQIIIIAVVIGVLIGSGYLGIYIFNQNSKFKKFLTTKNIIIISLIYIVAISFITGKDAAYGIGALFTPYIVSIINSLFRNKFKFKKTFDAKFYPFFVGVLAFGFISTTLSAIF
tara:strand:- start:226 stop:582 length:357 start_codon:yes stop_codon:yes gene_type:complete